MILQAVGNRVYRDPGLHMELFIIYSFPKKGVMFLSPFLWEARSSRLWEIQGLLKILPSRSLYSSSENLDMWDYDTDPFIHPPFHSINIYWVLAKFQMVCWEEGYMTLSHAKSISSIQLVYNPVGETDSYNAAARVLLTWDAIGTLGKARNRGFN